MSESRTKLREITFSTYALMRPGEIRGLKDNQIRPLMSTTLGYQFDKITIRLTYADYISTRVSDWIKHEVMCRLGIPGSLIIQIETV